MQSTLSVSYSFQRTDDFSFQLLLVTNQTRTGLSLVRIIYCWIAFDSFNKQGTTFNAASIIIQCHGALLHYQDLQVSGTCSGRTRMIWLSPQVSLVKPGFSEQDGNFGPFKFLGPCIYSNRIGLALQLSPVIHKGSSCEFKKIH